jgi:oligopeptide transport system permease protein
MMYGSRVSLMVGFLATIVALTIGVTWGTVAGFAGGKVDTIMMRIVDILYGIPFIIFVILLMVIFGRNLILLFMAIGAVEWLTMARIVRSQVMSLSKQEFILAAEAMGVSKTGIIYKHLIPNTIGPVIVYATLTVPQIMLLEAFLSFLGLGVQAPLSSWGLLIRDGAVSMEEYWWLLIFPSLAFSLTLFSLNFIGDGLRDALDPRTADS